MFIETASIVMRTPAGCDVLLLSFDERAISIATRWGASA